MGAVLADTSIGSASTCELLVKQYARLYRLLAAAAKALIPGKGERLWLPPRGCCPAASACCLRPLPLPSSCSQAAR